MLNNYNLTIVLKADLKDEGKEEYLKKLEKLVKTLDGKMGRAMDMGRKQLAYRIKGKTEGIYVDVALELPGAGVVELGKKLNNDSDLLRHLLVRV